MAKKQIVESKGKFQDALDKLNKTYGKGTILTLEDNPYGEYDVISTGSIGFDWNVLGIGGFAKGKLYEVMGWEGTGKSTICGHAVAECQKKGGVALYIDGEHAVDKIYFQALGVDTSKMLLSQPSCGEEGFNIALEMIYSGKIDLIIIDSDSSLIPKKVLDGDIGEFAIGKKAILNSNAYPKLKTALANNNVCVIVISQYREKIGVMFGNPTTTQGGHALKFYTDGRIEISRSLGKEDGVNYGNITKVKATKNKMSPPYRLSEFDIVYGQGIDKIGEVLQLMNDYEIGRKYGKTITVDDIKYDLEEFKTMLKDPKFYEEIKEKIISKIHPEESLKKKQEETKKKVEEEALKKRQSDG